MERNTEARELCDLISEKLPMELVDIVYAYVEPYPQVLEVNHVQQEDPLGDKANTQQVLERYLDTNIVSLKFAEGKMKVFHRETVFSICRVKHLTRFLSQNRWREYEHLIPKELVRNIHIKIPVNQINLESAEGVAEYPGQPIMQIVTGDVILNEPIPLQTLIQKGIRITLDIRSNCKGRSFLLLDHIMEAVEESSSHERPFETEEIDHPEDLEFEEWENTEDFELISRLLLLMLMKHLLPFLQDLVKNGHDFG
ncbi:hypothetical protein BKA58DRAFT_461720 [Alternaria rosae]|uniref:uncharacterized protein n=1 Tax=Alternaria rosae TaxID=1187941 RepID=UPI001E8DBCA2|nr:uncharacterized protein BKA58DRAFT_461720 [Alternaria rosae]KAH6865734.1 hypothetical protein BKA58DRAFT_461720 [Alternaria rosae]